MEAPLTGFNRGDDLDLELPLTVLDGEEELAGPVPVCFGFGSEATARTFLVRLGTEILFFRNELAGSRMESIPQ